MQVYRPHNYQQIAYKFARRNRKCMLMLDMGLGKTIVTLTLIKDLLSEYEIFKPLIVAPKFVAEDTWPSELEKWQHLKGLKISIIAGTVVDRIKAIRRPHTDIYIVSRDNLQWLRNYLGRAWFFDMLVLDESSNFKNQKSKRWKAVRGVLPVTKRIIELTGTPIPNGLIDLWAQIFLLDQGERLHKFQKSMLAVYFDHVRSLQHGSAVYEIKYGAAEKIYTKISDICLSMKAVDWLDMPELRNIVRTFKLDNHAEYEKFRKEKILELPEGQITALNAGSLYTKMLQYANGSIKDTDNPGVQYLIHDQKLDLLEEVVEELLGENVLIMYQFQSDIPRIKALFPDVVLFRDKQQRIDWDKGKINKLLAHAKTIAYGLNMQQGGRTIIWFGISNEAELYWQTIKRIHRQGQLLTVNNILLLAAGTAEYKIHRSLINKTFRQDQLFEALK